MNARRISVLFVALITLSSTALSAEVLVEGPSGARYVVGERSLTTVIDGEEVEEIRIPCSGAAAATAEYLFVGCGERGVLVVSLADPARPEPLELVSVEGVVEDVYLVRDRVWVDFADGTAEPFVYERAPGPEPAPERSRQEVAEEPVVEEPAAEVVEEPARPELPRVSGQVTAVRAGVATINLGKAQNLSEEMNIEFFRVHVDEVGGEQTRREERLGIGRILSLGDENAAVELPLNLIVEPGVLARPTRQVQIVRTSVPGPNGVMIAKATVRPFLPIGALGVGVLADASVGYRFEAPVAIDLQLSPLGVTATNARDVNSFAGTALLSYAADNFQVGFGLGAARVQTALGYDYYAETLPPETGVHFGATQYVRLGSVDGLHAAVTTNFVVYHGGWEFGGVVMEGQIPLHRQFRENTWLVGRAGGGVPGHALGELGLRILTVGNGGPGSLFVTPSVGFGSISRADYVECNDPYLDRQLYCREQFGYSGPMVGFGVEWRQ